MANHIKLLSTVLIAEIYVETERHGDFSFPGGIKSNPRESRLYKFAEDAREKVNAREGISLRVSKLITTYVADYITGELNYDINRCAPYERDRSTSASVCLIRRFYL